MAEVHASSAPKLSRRNKIVAVTAGLIVAIAGFALLITRAAGSYVVVDPDQATLSGNATSVVVDGNKAIQFNAPAPDPDPEPPASGRPNASNTGYAGYPDESKLKAWTGPQYNSSSNLTIDGYKLTGSFTFTGSNVVLKNCKITGGLLIQLGDNVRVENCELRGMSISSATNVTIRANNIHDYGGDGIHITSDAGRKIRNVLIADNYMHTPKPGCQTPTSCDHADGVQVRGADYLTFRNNTIDMGPWLVLGSGQNVLNSAIFLQSANGGNSNVTLDRNYLKGAGYTFYLGPGAGTRVVNNTFAKPHFGVVNNTSRAGDVVQWSGNILEDNGSTVPKP